MCNYSEKTALVSIGSNQNSPAGDQIQTLQSAVKVLSERDLVIRSLSRFFETPCFPAGAGPDYVNAALCVGWSGSPAGLLKIFHEIEREFARKREQRWGMRTLDLDLIAVGDLVLPNLAVHKHWRNLPLERQMKEAPEHLILPHPRVQERAFVLVPLMDIAPFWTHPILNKSVSAMCRALPDSEKNLIRAL